MYNKTKLNINKLQIAFPLNSIHLLTGYEGNSTFIVSKVPTIFRGNAEKNSWCRGDNTSDITRIPSL